MKNNANKISLMHTKISMYAERRTNNSLVENEENFCDRIIASSTSCRSVGREKKKKEKKEVVCCLGKVIQ